MVHTVRVGCVVMIGIGPYRQRLAIVAFNHQSMTALPLFQIMRAMVMETLSPEHDDTEETKADLARECEIAKPVLSQIAKDYSDAVQFRNDMLHATWFIGEFGDTNAVSVKIKVTGDGIKSQHLAEDAQRIEDQIEKCKEISRMIERISLIPHVRKTLSGVTASPPKLSSRFKQERGRWIICDQSQEASDHQTRTT